MKRRNQSGFASFEIVAVVAVLVIIGAVGYAVMKRNHNATDNTVSSTTQTKTSTVPSAPQIKTTGDLATASKTLDETNLDASSTDSSQLDSQLSTF